MREYVIQFQLCPAPLGTVSAHSEEVTVDVSSGFPFNQITPWSRVFRKKLTGPQAVKKFPAFYETGKFITAFTTAQHLSLS